MKKKRIVRMLTMASVMMLLVVFLAVPAYATVAMFPEPLRVPGALHRGRSRTS